MQLCIDHALLDDAPVLAQMLGDLLREIMAFYRHEGFSISGGRKLKVDLI